MDFSANLSMKGATTDAMVRSAAGEVSLRGHDLTLEIGDIDKELARYQSSQNFNLVDVGALFFAGPLGLAVTKGFNFAGVFQSSSGSSQIRTLVSEWRIERGVAQAKDVAMTTKENRIALKGGLDFVNGRFKEVTVALDRRTGMRHGAAENSRPIRQTRSGKAERSDIACRAGAQAAESSQEPFRREVRCVLRRLGGDASLASR
jgi:hypothetical protein